MLAIRVHEFGEPDVLRLEDIEAPTPGDGEVLVRVEAAGVNPVDTYVRAGAYERLPDLPYIPGGDGAGVVKAVGPDVRRFRQEDRVYIAGAAGGGLTGCSASLTVKPESWLHPLPERLSFEQGAAVGVPYATAFRALLHKGEATSGETVLVHGASGAVGLAAVQIAVARGMRVIGTASSEQGRETVRQQGASLVLDHSRTGYLDMISQSTDGRGVDVILEMAAHANLDHDLEIAALGGRIVVVGCRGPVEIQPRHALVKDLTIRGFSLSSATGEEMAEIHGALVDGFESGELTPVVGRSFPFSEAASAHRAVTTPGSVIGKVVLVPDSR